MSFPHIFKLNDALNKSILNQSLTDGKINDVRTVFKVLQPEEISVHTFKAKDWSFIERLWKPSWPRGRLTVASVPTDDCPCWRRRRLKPELPISTTEGKCYQKIIAPQQQPFSQFPCLYVLNSIPNRWYSGYIVYELMVSIKRKHRLCWPAGARISGEEKNFMVGSVCQAIIAQNHQP